MLSSWKSSDWFQNHCFSQQVHTFTSLSPALINLPSSALCRQDLKWFLWTPFH